MRPTLSVLIVSWNSREELARTLPALLPELGEGDELVVVDNDSGDGTPEALASLAPAARLLRSGRNAGFAAACNEGAAEAKGDLLVILNPDAAPRPGFGEAIRRPWVEGRGWAAWQALVADRDGKTINSAGNPVHFTGIVWAGGHGRPLDEAPPAGEVAALSGACLAIPRRNWEEAGGFPAALLPLPRGRRPLAAAAPRRRGAWDRAGGGRRPRLRVRLPPPQVALAGAQPLGLPDPRLPGAAAGARRPRPARHRAGPDPGRGRRRVGEAEAGGEYRRHPLAAPPAARAAPPAGDPHDRRRRVRRLAHPRPRLPLHPGDRPLGPGPRCPARLLAHRAPPAPPRLSCRCRG